jgi:4-hydroxybenzoate polyprenyltransferase
LFDSVPPLVKIISSGRHPNKSATCRLAFFTALFLEASTFALNDYFDLDIDIVNKRNDRPLVRGDIKPKTALILFGVFFPLGIVLFIFC